jgi:flagellar biogenesis protein FliO
MFRHGGKAACFACLIFVCGYFPVFRVHAADSAARVSGQASPSRPSVALTGDTPSSVVTRSVPAPAAADFENQPLTFPDGNRSRSRPAAERRTDSSLPPILSSLFLVFVICGIFVGILCLAKKYLPGHRQLFSHPAVEVLGRTHLDPRRYLSLIRIGKRILVVGVTPEDMRTLSEITDESEIVGIMEVARPKTEQGKNIFGLLFKQQVLKTEAEENRIMAEIQAREIEEQAVRLREKVAKTVEPSALGAGRPKSAEGKGRRLDLVG